jgi:hypothetical protein
METITSKEELLKIKLIDFYKNRENLNILLPIILQQTKISLRSLDWFVTNYCKKYNINYPLLKNGENKMYFPYKSYKSQLKAYSKKFCDPFCRRERVIFDYQNNVIINFNSSLKLGHKDYIITTIGQLNFFRFAIQDSIITYALENISDIETDMNSTLKNRESEKVKNKNGSDSLNFVEVKNIKRKELSIPGNKSVHITRISATIKFV